MEGIATDVKAVLSQHGDTDLAEDAVARIIRSRTGRMPTRVRVSVEGRGIMARVTMPGGQEHDFQTAACNACRPM